MLLGAVQGLEEGDDVALVSIGRGGETRLVDTVVDEIVLPLVGLFNIVSERLGVNVDAAVLFIQELVKLHLLAARYEQVTSAWV